MRAEIVAIAKKENDYVNEWVKHHIDMGFDFIYLFDNNDSSYEDVATRISNDYKKFVEIIRCNDKKKYQFSAYETYRKNYYPNLTKEDFVAIIDLDEFICIDTDKYKTVKDYLKEVPEKATAVSLCWMLMGEAFFKSQDIKKPLKERIKFSTQNTLHSTRKNIVRGGRDIKEFSFTSCHHYCGVHPRDFINNAVNSDFSKIEVYKVENWTPKLIYDNIYIKHYHLKSLQDFIKNKYLNQDAVYGDGKRELEYYFDSKSLVVLSDKDIDFLKLKGIDTSKIEKRLTAEKNLSQKCTGCGTCINICPKKCISFKENNEGFKYPKVNNYNCIHCDLCKKTCPVLNTEYNNKWTSNKDMIKAYAYKSKPENLKGSSSGAFFNDTAEYILDKGGVVCGAVWGDNLEVYHKFIKNKKDLNLLKMSKYVQSDTRLTFTETKDYLEKNIMVLYCGTPCQIAGLNKFLGKNYDNLITIDILCNSVPNSKQLRMYMQEGGMDNTIPRFRKSIGWGTTFIFKKGGKDKELSVGACTFYKGFLRQYSVRKSCYGCKFSKLIRQGDITIGDFWTAKENNLKFDFSKGTNIILLNNSKGKTIFNEIIGTSGCKYQEVPIGINLGNGICEPSATEDEIRKHDMFSEYFKSSNKFIWSVKKAEEEFNKK